MSCKFTEQRIQEVINFHGHNCPGLTIGIRVAEYALREFNGTAPDDLVCLTETDMCGVDGIQYLTGCTFGKGNLIHLDHGKAAFTFYDRNSDKALRFLLRPSAKLGEAGEKLDREQFQQKLMSVSLEELFSVAPAQRPLPRSALVLDSMCCETCGEETMESRTRRFAGKTLCISCFAEVEQKV